MKITMLDGRVPAGLGLDGVEIRKFHLISTKNTWYNLKIPAPAINDILPTSRR